MPRFNVAKLPEKITIKFDDETLALADEIRQAIFELNKRVEAIKNRVEAIEMRVGRIERYGSAKAAVLMARYESKSSR